MADDIKAGDRFLVEVEVTGEPVYGPYPVKVAGGKYPSAVSAEILLASKRLPRALRAGDRVTHPNAAPVTAKIEWTDGENALVRWKSGLLNISRVEELTPAEDAP